MKAMNIFNGADLKKLSEAELVKHFGKVGRFYFRIVRGVDDRPVNPDEETKSIGAEDTFPIDLTRLEEMNAELDKIAITVHRRLNEHKLQGRTITLKIKYGDFKQITRSRSILPATNDMDTILDISKELLLSTDPEGKPVRLLGISVSNFNEQLIKPKPTAQLPLFDR